MAGSVISVSVDGMRSQLPYFADATKYPDAVLTVDLDNAQNYISPLNFGPLRDNSRVYAVYLMAGHLQLLRERLNAGQTGVGIQTAASVDKVSVTLTPPPIKEQYDYWLNLTPFGAELLFLLGSVTGAGWYIGGSDENVFR